MAIYDECFRRMTTEVRVDFRGATVGTERRLSMAWIIGVWILNII